MKNIYLFLLLNTLLAAKTFTQNTYNALQKPNTFQNPDNPNYWKNTPPHPGYWQQDVHYTIDANINETTHIIEATEKLVYWNNSPDTLYHVFFHLYQNAFQPESYYDKMQIGKGNNPKYGVYETQKLGTEIHELTIDGKNVTKTIDNSIMKVTLNEPLLPNQKITFDIKFDTYFEPYGSVRRRMKMYNSFGNKHYNGVHWYPRISVYDRKFGWTTDQHLGREFYGDFGTFDVSLTFASNYIVGATGNLTNRNEVLPESLREKLDIKNFKEKPWNEKPSVIIPYDSTQRKTWVYHAENVHDFAFTADPSYRIGEARWKDKICYALCVEPHASKWQNAAQFAADVVKVYSEDFGHYTYHKMIVADAADGMEYPMLTLDGGKDPSYRGLLAHEIGHNWFFGQIGNNETYRATLDEGFTQFLTGWALEKIDGDTLVRNPYKRKYKEKHKKKTRYRDTRIYLPYLNDDNTAAGSHINTHSYDYAQFTRPIHDRGRYRAVYFKTATMLHNLQYVLGDSLFLKSMQHYFAKWKIAHPYTNDFRNAVINYTHVDLNWFFDQWLESTKTIDYAVSKVKYTKENNPTITFTRRGAMQMPLDFSVVTKKGDNYDFHISNSWFTKNTSATVLPKWTGFGALNKKHTVTLPIQEKIKNVIIDPSGRLADVNQLNNTKKLPVSLNFDHRMYNPPNPKKLELFMRPDLWYNKIDGIKYGLHINGNYMKKFHDFDATLWLNSGLLNERPYRKLETNYDSYSFRLNYATSTHKFMKYSRVHLHASHLDGLKRYEIGFHKKARNQRLNMHLTFKSMVREYIQDTDYLLTSNNWIINSLNNTLNTGVSYPYWYSYGKGNVSLNLRSSTLFSDVSYSHLQLESVNYNSWNNLDYRTRFFLQIGTGDTPQESAIYLSGANPEEMMDNKFTRSQSFFPADWTSSYYTTPNNFQFGGGLNLRGYSGYLAPEKNDNDSLVFSYYGNTGAAFNIEIDFDQFFRIRPRLTRKVLKLDTYIFADIGTMDYRYKNKINKYFINARANAGLGALLTIKRFGPLQLVEPLRIRFDVPLLLTRTPYSQEFVQYRWLFGINRSF